MNQLDKPMNRIIKSTTLQKLENNKVIKKLPRQCGGILGIKHSYSNNVEEIVLKKSEINQDRIKLIGENKLGDEKSCVIVFNDTKFMDSVIKELKKINCSIQQDYLVLFSLFIPQCFNRVNSRSAIGRNCSRNSPSYCCE